MKLSSKFTMRLGTLPLLVFSAILFGGRGSESESLENITNGSSRAKRDPGFSVFLSKSDKMAMAARVVTGISLRIGLTDKSIPGEEAIAELLNIGTVKLEDLQKFDKAKVDEFASKLNSLNVKESSSLTELEDMILLLDEWRQGFSPLDNIKDTSVVDEYFSKVQEFQSSGFNSTIIDQIVPNFDTALNILGGIEQMSTDMNDPSVDFALQLSNLQSLKKELDKYATLQQSIDKMLGICKQFEDLKKGKILRSQQYRFVQLFVDIYSRSSKIRMLSTSTTTTLNTMFVDATALFANLGASKTDVMIVSEIDASLNSKGRASSHGHTPGFINGYTDLRTVSNDAQNSWLKSTLKGYDSEMIVPGLAPFSMLYDKSKDLADKWKPIVNGQIHESIRRTTGILRSFGKVNSSPVTGVEFFAKINSCVTALILNLDDVAAASSVFENVVLLRNKLNTIIPMLDTIASSSSLKELTEFSDLRNSINFSTDKSKLFDELPNVTHQVKSFSGTKDLIRVIKELQPSLEHLHRVIVNGALNVLSTAIFTTHTEVNSFVTGAPAAQLTQWFQCPTKKIPVELSSLSNAISFIREIRDVQARSSFLGDIETATTTVSNSIAFVQPLRSALATISTAKDSGTAELLKLKSLVGSSKPFGDAVRALSLARKVLENSTSVDVLLTKVQLVDDEIETISEPRDKVFVRKAWGDSELMKQSLEEMMGTLKTATSAARRRRQNPSGLDEFGKMFTSLSGLKDVNLDVDQKLKALDDLVAANPSSGSKVQEVRTALTEVGALDLQFARYTASLSAIPGTLTSISNSFVSTIATTTKPPAAGSLNGNTGSPNTSPANPLSNGPAPAMLPTSTRPAGGVIWGLVIAGVLVFAMIAALLIFYFVSRKRKNEAEAAEAEKARLENVKQENKMKEIEAEKVKAEEERQKAEEDRRKAEEDRLKAEEDRKKAEEKIEEAKAERKAAEDKKQQMQDEVNQNKKNVEKMQQDLIKKSNDASKQVEEAKREKERAEMKQRDALKDADNANKALQDAKRDLENARNTNIKNESDMAPVARIVVVEFFANVAYTRKRGSVYIHKPRTSSIIKFFFICHFASADVAGDVSDMVTRHTKIFCRRRDMFNYSKCLSNTAVKLAGYKRLFYHANLVTYPLLGKAIAAQSPIGPSRGREGTVEAFLWMIWQESVEQIVMISKAKDDCGKYFSPVNGENCVSGQFEVTTVDSELAFDEKLMTRTLSIKKTGEADARIVKHYQLLDWSNDVQWLCQKSTRDAVLKVSKEIRRKEDHPPVVHCSDGVTCTGMVISIDFLVQYVMKHGKDSQTCTMVFGLRKMRADAIDCPELLMFAQNLALEIMIEEANATELVEKLLEQWMYFEKFNDLEFDKKERDVYLRNM